MSSIRDQLSSSVGWDGVELDDPSNLAVHGFGLLRSSLYNSLELLRVDSGESLGRLGEGEGGKDKELELHEEDCQEGFEGGKS
jgi:hypothetical protein